MPDLSCQEKSILGVLGGMVVVYGYYFAGVLRGGAEAGSGSQLLGRLIGTVILLVIIQIVYHILIAVTSGVEPKDERDILIESKAYRNAYVFLVSGICLFILEGIMINVSREAPTATVTPFAAVNFVLFFMVLAEITKLATQLFYYRRGVR